jgi:polysaccharide biosynthesis protein PslG
VGTRWRRGVVGLTPLWLVLLASCAEEIKRSADANVADRFRSGSDSDATPLTDSDQRSLDQVSVNFEASGGLDSLVKPDVPPGSGGLYGYCVHVGSNADKDAYVSLASNGGARTIREDFGWAWTETSKGVYNWSTSDTLMTLASQHGLRVLMIAMTTPSWASGVQTSTSNWYRYPPTNPADYGDFAGKLASRYGKNGTFWSANPSLPKVLPVGIEIWNEPNIKAFWPAGPDPVKYTAMLKAAYQAVKAADPSVPVIAGALAPKGGYNDWNCDKKVDQGIDPNGEINGINFLIGIYQNGGSGFFDAVSTHPYSYSKNATASQMLSYQDCSAWSQMAQTNPSLRSVMTSHGDGAKAIWATELGAPTCIAGASYPCVAEAEQGNLATQQMALWKSYGWSGAYYWYDLRDHQDATSTTDKEQHFGAVHADNSVKPAYTALQKAFASP